MKSIRISPNHTYIDYLNWEGKWEVIDGIACAIKLALTCHQSVVNEIVYLFYINRIKIRNLLVRFINLLIYE